MVWREETELLGIIEPFDCFCSHLEERKCDDGGCKPLLLMRLLFGRSLIVSMVDVNAGGQTSIDFAERGRSLGAWKTMAVRRPRSATWFVLCDVVRPRD